MAGIQFEIFATEKDGRRKKGVDLTTDLRGEQTLEDLLKFLQTTLIIASDLFLKQEQAKGFDKEPLLIVDNRPNKPIQFVKPFGKVEFVARANFTEVFVEAYNELLKRSKVLTGQYKSSHYVFFNGKQVATDLLSLQAWVASGPTFAESDRVRIVNIQPYARRLELLGVTAQRTQNRKDEAGRRKGSKKAKGTFFKVPNGAYQLTSRVIRNRYKRNVVISFQFLSGSSLGLAGVF